MTTYQYVSHSVPGSVGFAIETPVGTVFHTGDYKFDRQPVDGRGTDEDALRRLGDKGMLALFSDCVRVENRGWTGSESMVSENLEKLIDGAAGRVIVTTFASNLARLRQVVHIAHRLGRRVAVAGRSMDQNLKVAAEIGYLGAPEGTLIDLRESHNIPPSKLVVLLNRREPIALHCPVIELAPVPGRPMLPVIRAMLISACARRTPS